MQLGLFSRAEADIEPSFARAEHVDLGSGAWLEFVPGWTAGAQQAMALLLSACSWEQHEREMYDRVVPVPRLVASRPGRSVSSVFADARRIRHQPASASGDGVTRANRLLDDWGRRLGRRYGRELSQVSLAHYRDGSDSVAFHGDKLGVLRDDTVVAIVSLGSRRRFLLRPARGIPGTPRRFEVGDGDLLVMGGTCQRTWEHAVPKAREAGPRVAVIFRQRWDEAVRPMARATLGSPGEGAVEVRGVPVAGGPGRR